MSSNPLHPGKTPMKAKTHPVHISYGRQIKPDSVKEKCDSCLCIAVSASVGIITAILVILFC